MKRLPTYFLSHGGGPWSYLTDAEQDFFGGVTASSFRFGQAG